MWSPCQKNIASRFFFRVFPFHSAVIPWLPAGQQTLCYAQDDNGRTQTNR